MDKEVEKQTDLMRDVIKMRLGVYENMITVGSTRGYDYTIHVNGRPYINCLTAEDAWDILDALCKGFETGLNVSKS